MKRDLKVEFDPDTGRTTCYLIDLSVSKEPFLGFATCHPDDMDMMSEFTGGEIASRRAIIKYLQFIKDCAIQPQLDVLKHLYDSMRQSKQFNRKSYEARMLYRQIKIKERELSDFKDDIQTEKNELKKYMDDKEKLFIKIRKQRDQDKNS